MTNKGSMNGGAPDAGCGSGGSGGLATSTTGSVR
jgi:hypothetical protein